MKEEISALLLHAPTDSLGLLKLDLESQSIKVCWLRNCEEALRLLKGLNPPHLVFTETTLPDGSWADVVNSAVEAPQAVNVIVVARLEDIGLYLETIAQGAFDFIVLPLAGHELAHVVRCAVDNVLGRRKTQASADARSAA
jgi:DNA-binding NtrC family response regulator